MRDAFSATRTAVPARTFVTVVSGLPRSGTSLMMQMLRAGGLPLLCDERRPADADNPHGYFEYEPVTRTARDGAWVAQAQGRAVKVIHALVPALPPGPEYRVLLMQRALGEVLASQAAMLERTGQPRGELADERLAEIYRHQLDELEAWAARQAHIRLLRVRHAELLAGATGALREIDRFLGGGLDTAAMGAAVEPALHRQRPGGGKPRL